MENGIPETGSELMAWILRQPNSSGVRASAYRRARSRHCSASIHDWTPNQVAAIYRELADKEAAGGVFRWGGAGAAEIRHVGRPGVSKRADRAK